jgi:hypothetical protein
VPTGASIESSQRHFYWTPTAAHTSGTYTFDVVVTDNDTPAMSDRETIAVTLRPVNTAPELALIGNRTINEEQILTFTAAATDPDTAQTLTFRLENGMSGQVPVGVTIASTTGRFTWTPTEAQGPGVYTFDVVVSDSATPSLSDRETITVTVADVNRAPMLTAIGNKIVNEGEPLMFTATASDADVPPNTLTFSLANGTGGQVPAGAAIDPATGDVTWPPTSAQAPKLYQFDVHTGIERPRNYQCHGG